MFSIVEPQNVRQIWSSIRAGLEHILRKSPEFWIPEDVYASLINNKATLWVLDDGKGFVVGYMSNEDFHIWCAYGKPDDLRQAFYALEDIVRGQCKRITFESWRLGWDKTARELGFRPRGWVKEL